MTFQRVSLQAVNVFTRQLMTLLRAGIPLLGGLDAVSQQTTHPRFRAAIQSVASAIRGGATLSASLAQHGDVFSPVYVQMVRTGESAGTLDQILERLARIGEQELTLRRRIAQALRYPQLVVAVMGAAILVLITFVIPRFHALYSRFGHELPWATRVLAALGNFIRQEFLLVGVLAALTVYGTSRWIRTPAGAIRWDRWRLKWPVFGPLLQKIILARACRTLAMLVKSGLPILDALALVRDSCGNLILAQSFDRLRRSVNEGRGLADPMRADPLFLPMVVQMVAIGEQSGALDELLLRVAEYYDEEIQLTIDNLTSLIEPLLILLLGGMILIVALAVFLPMWNMIRIFRPH